MNSPAVSHLEQLCKQNATSNTTEQIFEYIYTSSCHILHWNKLQVLRSAYLLYLFAGVTITKYYRLGGLNNTNLFFLTNLETLLLRLRKTEELIGLVPSDAFLLHSEEASPLSLCLYLVIPLSLSLISSHKDRRLLRLVLTLITSFEHN